MDSNYVLNCRSLRSLGVQKLRFWTPVSLAVRLQNMLTSRIEEIVEAATKRYLAIFSGHIRSADGKPLYAADFVMFGILNRNLGLLRAMPALVKDRNIHALAPLLRVQLDGLLRLHAYRIVDSIDDLALHVIAGNSLRKFKDRNGKELTDRHLVDSLKAEIEWVEPVYETLSGWIHLSESHVFSAVGPGQEEGAIVVAVGSQEEIPEQLFDEAVGAIEAIHSSTATMLEGYFGHLAGV